MKLNNIFIGKQKTPDDAMMSQLSGEIWGTNGRMGHTPTVRAYAGRLPDGEIGVEFVTDAMPTNLPPPYRSGQVINWSVSDTNVPSGTINSNNIEFRIVNRIEYAVIKVKVTKNTQIQLQQTRGK